MFGLAHNGRLGAIKSRFAWHGKQATPGEATLETDKSTLIGTPRSLRPCGCFLTAHPPSSAGPRCSGTRKTAGTFKGAKGAWEESKR